MYKRNIKKIENLKKVWATEEKLFIDQLKVYFSEIDIVKIAISPSLYGPIGTYEIYDTTIQITPRYDRSVEQIQRLIINALTHYFYFDKHDKMNKANQVWYEKQKLARELQDKILHHTAKAKKMTEILDTEFVGNLALESKRYLKKIGLYQSKKIIKPKNLTKNENIVFELFIKNQDKITTFDEISEAIWEEKVDEKYSEYAMTKLVNRIKVKLPKHTIHAQRKIGYFFC